MRSGFLNIRAVVEGHGYRGAPMSMLLVNDEVPGMVWQKGLNNMAKRHHIRLWEQPETWNGERIWIGAATRDVDYGYLRHGRVVTHKIEKDIDLERDKILHDIEFTSCANVADYVERPRAPRFTRNATGDPMETDGRIAIVNLNGCSAPQVTTWTGDPLPKHGNAFQRIVRRQILSIRNDYYRENLYWRTYEGTRWLITSIRNHRRANDRDPSADAPQSDRAAESVFDKARNSSWAR
jgi:hypothetical protein